VPVVRSRQGHRGRRRLRPTQPIRIEGRQRVGDSTSPGKEGEAPVPSPLTDPAFTAGLRPIPTGTLPTPRPAPTDRISGHAPGGEPVEVTLRAAGRILLCFLATRCDGCDSFWQGLGGGASEESEQLPADVFCVVITKSAPEADLTEVQRLSEGIRRWPVVMTSEAWHQFEVLSYPFFVLVEGRSCDVVGETVGFGWSDVRTMVSSPR
jgi:hypothetical protein